MCIETQASRAMILPKLLSAGAIARPTVVVAETIIASAGMNGRP
jgi:hypothetical protein